MHRAEAQKGSRMSTLVIGATDVVGFHVVQALVDRGERVLALTRSTAETDRLPEAVEGVLGDLSDLISLRIVFEGVENVVLITPKVADEARLGVNAVVAARAAAVDRLVFLSAHKLFEYPDVLHFAAKAPIERAIRESRVPWTIIRASNLFQSDALYRDEIVQNGVYPQPIGQVGVNRVDAFDVADAIVNALFEPDHDGEMYPLVGRDVQTGDTVAATYSGLLGRFVHYGGDDTSRWAKRMRGIASDWLIRDCETMWQRFQERGHLASPEDHALCRAILGREPRRFERYATEMLGPAAYRSIEIGMEASVT